MNKLAWAGIIYAIYLGVENWRDLQKLEETVSANNRLMLTLFESAGKIAQK